MTDSGPILDRWMPANGGWHAYKGDSVFWCGLRLVEVDESKLIQATEDDPYPPDPCRGCLHETAMRDTVEESLEHAKARGYYPADPLD